jgi:hypothetical protein
VLHVSERFVRCTQVPAGERLCPGGMVSECESCPALRNGGSDRLGAAEPGELLIQCHRREFRRPVRPHHPRVGPRRSGFASLPRARSEGTGFGPTIPCTSPALPLKGSDSLDGRGWTSRAQTAVVSVIVVEVCQRLSVQAHAGSCQVAMKDMLCQPVAPSGAGSLSCAVCNTPVLSVARTVTVCEPGVTSHKHVHRRQVSLE